MARQTLYSDVVIDAPLELSKSSTSKFVSVPAFAFSLQIPPPHIDSWFIKEDKSLSKKKMDYVIDTLCSSSPEVGFAPETFIQWEHQRSKTEDHCFFPHTIKKS